MPDALPPPQPVSVAMTVPAVLPESQQAVESKRITGRTAPRRRRWRSLLWLAALAAILSLQLWFPHLDSEVHDSYSVEEAGRKVFFELAATPDIGLPPVRRNTEPLPRAVEQLPVGSVFCLLGPSRVPTTQEWQPVLEWVKRGGSVVVAARWETPELEIAALRAKVVSVDETSPNAPKPGAGPEDGKKTKLPKRSSLFETRRHNPGPVRTTLLPLPNFVWQNQGKIEAPGAEPLVWEGERPQAVRIRYGLGTVVLVASDYIFSNESLAETDRDNAGLAIQLLKIALPASEGAETDPNAVVVFDEFLNTTGTPKVVGVMLNSSLRPITLQILALMVLFGMTGSRRFGGLLPRATPERRDITEHINSLGLLYYRANSSQHLLTLMLERVRQELRLRGDKDPDPVTWASAAQRVRKDPAELRNLLLEAKEAIQNPKLPRRKGASLLRQLAELRHAARRR